MLSSVGRVWELPPPRGIFSLQAFAWVSRLESLGMNRSEVGDGASNRSGRHLLQEQG
jgi:hypothetical protein